MSRKPAGGAAGGAEQEGQRGSVEVPGRWRSRSIAAPSVPITPWTDEAVPAIGAICSIASVPKFDEVKAKQRHGQPRMMTNDRQALVAAERDCRMDRGDHREGERAACGRPGAARSARRRGELSLGGERHRRGDRRRTPGRSAGPVEHFEHDLLDRGDVGDQRRRR